MDVFFQVRYSGLLNSNKQPNYSPRAEATPVFTSFQYCFPLLFCFVFLLSCSGVNKRGSTFWTVTMPFLIEE